MKKFLTFLALACFMVAGAWAQTVVTQPQTEDGYTYTIHCAATSGHDTHPWLSIVDGAINAQAYEADATRFKFDSPAEGQYRIIDVASGKYLEVGSSASLVDTPTMYWTLSPQADGVRFLANGVSGQFMNNNGDLALRGGTGGCSSWVLTEYSTVEKTYTVHITGAPDGTKVTYNSTQYGNGDEITGTGLAVTDFTAENVEGYTVSISISGTTINVVYTAMPFAVGKTYRLTLRGGQVVYDANSGQFSVGTATTSVTDKNSWFTIGGSSAEGYTLFNVGSSKYVYHADTTIDNSKATTTENEADATKYIWKEKNGQSFFLINGTANQYVNKRDNYFSTWNSGAGYGDPGSVITFEEVDMSVDAAYKVAKAEAETFLANAANISALYTSTAISTATTAINGITYDASSETSVNAAIETLNGIIETFYASANGKKVALVSKNDWSTRGATLYLTLDENPTANMAAAAEKTVYSVFSLTYSTENKAYAIQTVYTPNSYVGAPSGNSNPIPASVTPVYFTITPQAAKENAIVKPITVSQGLHVDGGKNIVGWDATAGASQWAFESVTDEAYNEMVQSFLAQKAAAALKAALDEAADAYAVNDAPLTEDDIDDDLITDGSQFYSPYTYADDQKVEGVVATEEQVYSFLLDGDTSTYWHSTWLGGNQPAHLHYLQVSLTEPISGSIQLTMNRRKTNADQITKMSVEYSTDGNTYTQLPGYMTFPAGTNGEQIQGTFHLPTNASYLRFYEDETTSNRGYWHCSEFQLNEVTASKNTQNATVAAALQEAMATAQANPSTETIEALQTAIETYKASMNPDVTYTYTLTDENGDTYTGSFTSNQPNPEPTITGVQGYSLDKKEWSDDTFTADITFPFPVKTATRIASFNNNDFLWQADGTTVKVVKGAAADSKLFDWIIIPSFDNGAFTFKIQNVLTSDYICADSPAVYLNDEGAAALTFESQAFKTADGEYLSLNSSTGQVGSEQLINLLNRTHSGTSVRFDAPSVIPTSIDITIGATGYATMAYSDDFVKPEGLTVYYCTEGATSSSLNTVEWDKNYLPGMCCYILEGTPNTTYTFNYLDEDFEMPEEDYEAVTDIFYNGALYGNFGDTAMTVEEAKEDYGENIYVFSQVDDILGFYKYAGTTLAAHKAFYATENASINGFSLDFGGQTVGVNSVISATNLKAGYDIQGRRINKIQKGISILNGKKIIK